MKIAEYIYDFSTLNTKLPHNMHLDVPFELTDFCYFKEVTKLSLKLELKEKVLGLKSQRLCRIYL